MNPANATNAPSSATTSPSAQANEALNKPDSSGKTAAPLSESAYLKQHAEAAQASIAAAMADLKASLASGVDPRVIMQTHPWMTLASAAVAGFAAAAATIPSKEQQALRKLTAIERALYKPYERSGNGDSHGNGSSNDEKAKSGGIMDKIIHELIAMARPILVSLVTNRMGAGAEPDPEVHGSGESPTSGPSPRS